VAWVRARARHREGALFIRKPAIGLLKNLVALEKTAAFSGSSVAGADNAPAVERKF